MTTQDVAFKSRRIAAASLLMILCGTRIAHAEFPATLPNGVASGDVTQTTCVLWARSTALGAVTFEYSTSADFNPIAGSAVAAAVDPEIPVKVEIENLTPATRYYYRATNTAADSVTGVFKTPADAGAKHGLRFGCSGDWRGDLAPYPSVSNAPERDLDFFVAHGDTIYADYVSPAVPNGRAQTLAELRSKYEEVYGARFGAAQLADLRASCAWFATIDDHEVINDWAGGAPPSSDSRFDQTGAYLNETQMYARGLQAFHEFHPIRSETYGETGDARTANKVKLYRKRRFGDDAMIFVLDARSFRDAELPGVTDVLSGEGPSNPFEPGRTLLGQTQLDDLKADLLEAEDAGVTWKVVFVPEPIQNGGPIGAADRYEGYAAERTELLQYIDEQHIRNVMFVAADIHCTLVNEIGYQRHRLGRLIPLRSFEVVVGPVAFAGPFGPTVYDIGSAIGLLGPFFSAIYNNVPNTVKDDMIIRRIDLILRALRLDPVGLEGFQVPATLLEGKYYSLQTYGWTEFEIDPESQDMTVTAYGIDWYGADALDDPAALLALTPRVVSRFTVKPDLSTGTPPFGVAGCGVGVCGDGLLLTLPVTCLVVVRRRRSRTLRLS